MHPHKSIITENKDYAWMEVHTKVNATEMSTGATHCSSAYSQLFLLTQMANLKLDLQGNKSDYVGDQDLRQLSCKFTLCQLGLKLDMTIAVGQKKCSRLDRQNVRTLIYAQAREVQNVCVARD